MSGARNLRVTVDRIEGDTFVLIAEDDRIYEVARKELAADCRAEGAVLDVPVAAQGVPDWAQARRNTGEEGLRRRDARQALDRLKKRDPGGDVEL
jgi:hypothetical protein